MDNLKNKGNDVANHRKRRIKLISAAVMLVIVIIVLSFAWYAYSHMGEYDGIGLTAVDAKAIAVSMDAYYCDGNGSGGDWTQLSDGFDFYPNDYATIKFVLKNKSEEELNYYLEFGSLKVKYYSIQPYDRSLWSVDDNEYFYKTDDGQTTLFGYDKEYIQAGDYTYDDNSASRVYDYHNISTEDFLALLEPCTNAVEYVVSGYTEIPEGATDEETLENAKNKVFTSQMFTNAKAYIDTTDNYLCQTDKQDLTRLNTSDPVDIIPADSNFSYSLSNALADTNLSADGKITIPANKTVVVYMTLYYNPNKYSSAEIDGLNMTLENSNPYMLQRLYLNDISMKKAE